MKLTGRKLFAFLGLAAMTLMIPLAAYAEPPLDVNKSTCGEFVDYFNAAQADDKAHGNTTNPMKSKFYELMVWSAETNAKIIGTQPDDMTAGMGIYGMCMQNRDASMMKAIKMLR